MSKEGDELEAKDINARGDLRGMNEHLKCPICLDVISAAHSTSCGHTFCHACIMRHLVMNQFCPTCSRQTAVSDLHPNHALERMVKKMRKCSASEDELSLLESDDVATNSYNLMDEKYQSFLASLLSSKQSKLAELQRGISIISEELQKCSSPMTVPINHDVVLQKSGELGELFDKCVMEKKDFRRYFDRLTMRYTMRPINSVVFGDVLSPTNVVSSVEYNQTRSIFAVSGSQKQIRVYDYELFSRPIPTFGGNQTPIPLVQLTTACKVATLAWDPSPHTEILAAADYEGSIKLYNIEKEQVVVELDQHERRVWAIDFNKTDHNLLLSGSDDGRLKQWSIKDKTATFTIDAKANICTVQYHPDGVQLAFGAADHSINVHDIRTPSRPIYTIKEHKKAVSYVRWLDRQTLLSASTDNTIKQWNSQECIKQHRGHQHEKNFVGLSVLGDWFVCGSETNRVCLYSRHFEAPVCELSLGGRDPLSGEFIEVDGFASSVAWVNESELLVGNSLGLVSAVSVHAS